MCDFFFLSFGPFTKCILKLKSPFGLGNKNMCWSFGTTLPYAHQLPTMLPPPPGFESRDGGERRFHTGLELCAFLSHLFLIPPFQKVKPGSIQLRRKRQHDLLEISLSQSHTHTLSLSLDLTLS